MLSMKNMPDENSRRHDWTVIFLVAFAALLRLVFLGMKPPHFDEGVNGWFLDQMTRTGYYHYDPSNYHGPLHFYLLFLFQTLLGRSVWAIRLPTVLVSVATVWLVTKFDRFLDRRTCLIAALAMAVSPGAVFYSRYAIHESELVFFLILTVWGCAGMWRFGTARYLWAAGLGATGMILTKETYFIHLGSLALAVPCVFILEKISPSAEGFARVKQTWMLRDLAAVSAVCIALILFFYSGTFMDLPGLKGLYLTYADWFKTGQNGNGHEKPFYYWLTLILRYEWPALIGLAGSFFCVWPRTDRLIRWLAIYGCGALTAYSIVHYKTPWCIVTLIWPFYFVFGELVKILADKLGAQIYAITALVLAASLFVSVRLNFFHFADDKEQYVYVQTFTDIDKLTGPLFKLVAEDPVNYKMTGHILLESYHPLPWVLGDFSNIGYYDDKLFPDKMDADFLIVDTDRIEKTEAALTQEYFTEDFKLRNSMDAAKLYFNCKKFGALFPGRKPGFTPNLPQHPDAAAKQ